MDNKKTDLDNIILNNKELKLTPEQKDEAIKKEKYYRELYYKFFDLNTTKSFSELCKQLITGYDNMINYYQIHHEATDEQKYIIKFAFRDFFLLIFINMNQIFENNEYLKKLHKEVYMSQHYVNLLQFQELINYCKQYLENESK